MVVKCETTARMSQTANLLFVRLLKMDIEIFLKYLMNEITFEQNHFDFQSCTILTNHTISTKM